MQSSVKRIRKLTDSKTKRRFENKAFEDDIGDYPEKDYLEELKQENKYASKL